MALACRALAHCRLASGHDPCGTAATSIVPCGTLLSSRNRGSQLWKIRSSTTRYWSIKNALQSKRVRPSQGGHSLSGNAGLKTAHRTDDCQTQKRIRMALVGYACVSKIEGIASAEVPRSSEEYLLPGQTGDKRVPFCSLPLRPRREAGNGRDADVVTLRQLLEGRALRVALPRLCLLRHRPVPHHSTANSIPPRRQSRLTSGSP